MNKDGWIGFDLDGTLAEYHGWQEHIGLPIPDVVSYAKELMSRGLDVRIFTARGFSGTQEHLQSQMFGIQNWCKTYLGRVLPITNVKDIHMVAMVDDRAVSARRNKGQLIGHPELWKDIDAMENLGQGS
jgi:hydroxymethylpyrimidine pyrophosphatase-like HAD family hydrolase